jgi:hypothetical protein
MIHNLAKAICVLGVLGSGFYASASEWKRAELRSINGYQIQINFQTVKETVGEKSYMIARPLWIDVTRPGVGTVRAVLMNFVQSKRMSLESASLATSLQLDFWGGRQNGYFDENHRFVSNGTSSYAVEVKDGLIIGSDKDFFFQEIAILNEYGEWQKDPINGTSNFKFNLLKASGNE